MAKRFELAKKYTEKYRSTLLPCKYCGNTDIRVVSDRSIFNSRNEWSVVCSTPSCDCTRGFTHVKVAVEAWNKKHGEC